jgi:thiol-disulfide isomerase/thioredoxin
MYGELHMRRISWALLVSMLMIGAAGPLSSLAAGENEGSPRAVVLELFTGTWCATCPYADEAADMLSVDYGPERISVLQYHINKALDPMATDETMVRGNAYDWGSTGLPATYFDGVEDVTGLGEYNSEFFYDLYKEKIDDRVASRSPISITTTLTQWDQNVSVHASYEKTRTIVSSDTINARFVLYENSIQHNLVVYNYVVRKIEEKPFSYNGLPYTDNVTFNLQPEWDTSKIGIAVFVQVQEIGDVLQSANIVFGPKPSVTVTTDIDGKEISGVTSIEGTASQDASTVEVRIDGKTYATADGTTSWQFDIDSTKLSGGTHTLSVRSFSSSLIYSDVVEMDFEVKSDSMLLIIVAIVIVVAVLVAILAVLLKKRKTEV